MASTSGKSAWEKYFKGKDQIQIITKKTSNYYENETTTKLVGKLPPKAAVTYLDLASQHIGRGVGTKIGFQLNPSGPVYYSSVDNFTKPGAGSKRIGLKPRDFGIQNLSFINGSSYYTFLKNAIQNRAVSGDIGGELCEYLLAIVDFAKEGVSNFSNIEKDDLPFEEISKDFGELLGPLACIYGRCGGIGKFISNYSACKVTFPPDNVPLYDYILIDPNQKEYKISAKVAQGYSNQIKPQFVIPYTSAISPLARTTAYKVLLELSNRTTALGPFYALRVILSDPNGVLTDACINDATLNASVGIAQKSTKLSTQSLQLWEKFIKKYLVTNNPTYGDLRFRCEQLIQDWSGSGPENTNLKNIFNNFLQETRIIYVKTNINRSGSPSFSADGGDGAKIVSNLFLRTSNTAQGRLEDRMGFQIS